jgi:hypothetical protein
MKYTITGTIEVAVTAVVEADSVAEAEDIFDSLDCCVDTTDGDVTFTECSQNNSYVESTTCLAEEKWDGMSALERANVLKENGASDEAAFESAEMDFRDLDEEWQAYFDD